MAANRPPVPREIRQQVLFEARHRCAVCCSSAALDLAHIVPWRKVREHRAENLICLCCNCHRTADKEKWSAAYFHRYKNEPCVTTTAQRQTAPSVESRAQVVLSLPGNIEDYDPLKRRDLASAISSYLGLPSDDVVIRDVNAGSVKVTVELPADYAELLRAASKAEDPRLIALIGLSETIKTSDLFDGTRPWQRMLDAIVGTRPWEWIAILIVLLAVSAFLGAWVFSLVRPSAAPTAAVANIVTELPVAGLRQAASSDKADVAWMVAATVLAVIAVIPGLALYYAGQVRAKNALSVLMQVLATFALVVLLWCIYGYSLVFTTGDAFVGGTDRMFLGTFDAATNALSLVHAHRKGVAIPELLFVAFHAVVAGVAACLIVGGFAERIKFSAVLLFMAIWFTISYLPIAHMVWYWVGPDAYTSRGVVAAMDAKAGLLWQWGGIDFAGGWSFTSMRASLGSWAPTCSENGWATVRKPCRPTT